MVVVIVIVVVVVVVVAIVAAVVVAANVASIAVVLYPMSSCGYIPPPPLDSCWLQVRTPVNADA
jgi:hypothetical protein